MFLARRGAKRLPYMQNVPYCRRKEREATVNLTGIKIKKNKIKIKNKNGTEGF
jgi:hypothetical protein